MIHITREKCQVCLYDGPGFSLLCDPPQTVLKVSTRAEKSVPHYRGDNGFSILTGGTFTFKTVFPTPDCLKSLGESRKVCTPLQGDNGFSILSWGTFTFKTVSPTTSVCKGIFRAHLRCLSAMVYSVRISGVCLQGYFQGASQVFVCNGVFSAHLRCLQLTGTVIGPVSA